MNLGAGVTLDDLSTPNPYTGDVDGYMTGWAWLSLSASTVNKTEMPNWDYNAAFELLDYKFTSTPKCWFTDKQCYKGLPSGKPLWYITIKNVGK